MTALRALAWTTSILLAFGALAPAPARAAAPAQNPCGFTQQSADARGAAGVAASQGAYVTALQYQAQAQLLDEQSPAAQRQPACFFNLLDGGVALVQNTVLYGYSSEAWQYARHLTAFWESYQGQRLTPAEQSNYDDFFPTVAQALRGCYPYCPLSDDEVAQTRNQLLTQP